MANPIEEIYGEHCIQHIKSVDKYDEPKLGDSRVLSPSVWIKSKMHTVGDSIDYKHSNDVTPDFGSDGHTYLLRYQFNELDESEMLDNFFFKSTEDRNLFEQANVECGVEYFLATKSYDERLHELCMMIQSDWFCNNHNVWNLAGFFARQPHSDLYLMRTTYLCVLKQKVERFNKEFAIKEFDGWFDSKYNPSLNEGKLKGIAAGCHPAAYKQWQDEYEVKEPRKTSTSKTFELSTLDQDFELTFKSERKLATLTQLVELTGQTIDDMRSAMVATSFKIDELEYWAEKYLVIENKPNRDFDLNFRSDITYYKRWVTEDDNSVIKAYDPKNFFKVQIEFIENKKPRSTKLPDLLNTVPFHKFANTVCKWEHDPNDMETFSLANPLLAKDLHEEITESDLHPVLVDYLKRIICSNHPERYQWLMEYIGSLYHYPDSKTKVMLVLYSLEKQIGKSNFFKLLTSLLGTVNTHMTQHVTNVFGERGSPQLRHKKLCWFEEIAGDKHSFRNCLERMKSAITDSVQSSRKLYHEEEVHGNITELLVLPTT
ncbi:hypothetical protein PPTG_10702 [Phytophthora nicotianae INRA-310]|uniref:NrS-1 polymerase-like helicase domain-containing protein n=1 Tax=Phytophthora nicotianae (strain INRA-310) TaxID=761204 RepID=W2QDI5_PHYN3|nr:hypothetical protein PPTG_10702 [Phytophthora nicotianae INRA-310]ETN10594.1 hypothetical protein PPTG_10702 [Phytophthora nicotianae INRA-310]